MTKQKSDNNNIVLKPKFIFWFTKYFFFIALLVFIILMSNSYRQHEVARYAGGVIAFVIFIYLFYKYVDILICTRWIITDEQILVKKGVFAKSVNYVELYRVYDYEEKKTFIQVLCRNTTIYILSGDKSHPVLCLFGLQDNDSIIGIIRTRVEKQREIKRIYEFTNN